MTRTTIIPIIIMIIIRLTMRIITIKTAGTLSYLVGPGTTDSSSVDQQHRTAFYTHG